MPRISRKKIQTPYLHVMTQGINKNYIFEKDVDIKYYIKAMYDLKDEHNIDIIAYCIMNNHAHILVKVTNIESLSKYMQRLNTKYGKYYNKKYSRVGFVFRDRYKSEGIFSKEHLYNCINYIYENPVKAGICNHPSEYSYSNYKKVKKVTENNYAFMDTEEEKEKEREKIIKEYIDNKKNLKELITILKDKNGMSFRKMAEALDINREKIRKIYNE